MSRFSEALITRVVVRGFRSLEHVAVDLDPLTVLVGPNGSGKSSFLLAFNFLKDAIYPGPQLRDVERFITKTNHGATAMSFEVHIRSRAPEIFEGVYFLRFQRREKLPEYFMAEETCTMKLADAARYFSYTVQEKENQLQPPQWDSSEDFRPALAANRLALPIMASLEAFAPMYKALTGFQWYNIHPLTLRTPQRGGQGNQLLPDGSNAASILKRLRDSKSPDFDRVISALGYVVESVQNVDTSEAGQMLTIEFKEHFGRRRFSFPASDMSDGILHVLGILLALYQEETPTLVGFEEPESAVHPGAVAALAEAFEEAALRTQVLVTTHSPDLITRFDVSRLRAVARTPRGDTAIGPIAESQHASVQEQLFTTGELQRIEGLRPSSRTSGE